MSELFLGLFIIGAVTAIIVCMAVVLGRKEDREAKRTEVEEFTVSVTEFISRR